MSAGRRGVTTRRSRAGGGAAFPNLAVAGKRETKPESSTGSGTQQKRGKRERGSRGRAGRGSREAGSSRFIQQQGIFSAGLNDDGRHDKANNNIRLGEFSVRSLGRIKKEAGEEEDRLCDEKPLVTYESEWMSDEEADNEELRELLQDGFLVDLKPGKIIPLVLPETEESQFQQLAGEKIKEDVGNGCEPTTATSAPPNKKKKRSNHRLISGSSSEEEKVNMKNRLVMKKREDVEPVLDPTATSSRRAAAIMQKLQQ
ncbi:unnamed protein product, partial [Gongylonema pulchrum]|uniref:DNA-directed RNA polymerase III subunit RPC4 n=1 Tax=Gongylonema pulchrum TaxID=637853 RepID=A0A183E278_9BILA